ncbi:ribonuclease Z [Cohnella terricola]|uniref:Ribonuclease Z n=1 Tax=Cohnella terricola TaxID=1289167 RepID=A0A559JMV6_9BACL|nr:ribonuclease Z [Cohnella terricola]TVY01215.1 ribonuclease Z [Cohnella terricola]
MELWFMGTGAGMPIKERNVTSVALSLQRRRGTFWLFDCGEGTQHRLLHSPLRLSRMEKLFVTHLHGDHVYGIPGLLSSRSSLGGTDPLQVYGPPGLRELIESSLRITGTHLDYPLEIKEIEPGPIVVDGDFTVEAAHLDHRIECFGYRVSERPRGGKLNVELLAELGVPAGPAYGELKKGRDIVLEDGRTIRSVDVLGAPLPGRIVAIMGDTRPTAGAVALARGADLLVHEATFGDDLAGKAELYGHSTSVQAAEIAFAAGVERLLLTHFSSRYKTEDLAELEAQARAIFPHTDAAVELVPYTVFGLPR